MLYEETVSKEILTWRNSGRISPLWQCPPSEEIQMEIFHLSERDPDWTEEILLEDIWTEDVLIDEILSEDIQSEELLTWRHADWISQDVFWRNTSCLWMFWWKTWRVRHKTAVWRHTGTCRDCSGHMTVRMVSLIQARLSYKHRYASIKARQLLLARTDRARDGDSLSPRGPHLTLPATSRQQVQSPGSSVFQRPLSSTQEQRHHCLKIR